MFTPIHQALGLEPGKISIELIERAVKEGVQETASLDWKAEYYDSHRPDWADEAAKDIAAMANSGGGWIVFGVAEEKETSAASKLKPIRWNSDEHQRILRTAYAHIGPPVLGLEFFPLPKDDGHIVIMRVPDSRDAPHFARKGNNAFIAPRRNGPHTAFMSDREIERGFRERFQYADDQERNLQEKFVRASQALMPGDGVFIAMAALPLQPTIHAKSPAQDAIYQLTTRQPMPELMFGQNQPRAWERGQVRIGMRQWVVHSHPDERAQYRAFLYDDSTVLAAYRLGNLSDSEEAKPFYPVGLPNQCMSRDIESAVINFVTLLRGHAEERHANGGFRIRAGLVGSSGEPIYIRTSEGVTNFLLSEEYAEPITAFQPVTVDLVDPLSPLQEMLPWVNGLARDLINQGGVKDLKIIADPKEYEQDATP